MLNPAYETYTNPPILTGFSTKSDGGASIRFSTNELSDYDVLELKRKQGTFGFLLYKESEFQPSDIPKGDPDLNNKSQAKRIRAVLYKIYMQQGGGDEFEKFYYEKTNKYIDYLKGKLETDA